MLTDLEAILPLELVREHIADDDTHRFSEAQLGLYREAAFEACEMYTGRQLRPGLRQIEEQILLPRGFSLRMTAFGARPNFHRLREPATTGLVSIISDGGTQQIIIAAGADRIPLHMLDETINFGASTCGIGRGVIQTMTAVYMTGEERAAPLPAGIRLGILKMIAWSVTNAGDTVVTVGGATATNKENQMQLGTNNAAVASGAVDAWRQYARRLTR